MNKKINSISCCSPAHGADCHVVLFPTADLRLRSPAANLLAPRRAVRRRLTRLVLLLLRSDGALLGELDRGARDAGPR